MANRDEEEVVTTQTIYNWESWRITCCLWYAYTVMASDCTMTVNERPKKKKFCNQSVTAKLLEAYRLLQDFYVVVLVNLADLYIIMQRQTEASHN